MLKLRAPSTSSVFAISAASFLCFVAPGALKYTSPFYTPRDQTICKKNGREAHIHGDSIGWINRSVLALGFKDASGKMVYEALQELRLNSIGESQEDKLNKARIIADQYCASGNMMGLLKYGL